jgi:two-component system, chemotaxis family, sensor kinase CheA
LHKRSSKKLTRYREVFQRFLLLPLVLTECSFDVMFFSKVLLMDEFELELKKDFIEEAIQLLDDSEQAFLDLEGDKENPSLMDKIFRLAHNLKGTSRAVGFGNVAEFTHEMENLILKLKNKEIPVTDEVVTVLLESNDHIRLMIETLKEDLDATVDSDMMLIKVRHALAGGQGEAPVGADAPAEKEPIEEEEEERIPDISDFAEFANAPEVVSSNENSFTEEIEVIEEVAAKVESVEAAPEPVAVEVKAPEPVKEKAAPAPAKKPEVKKAPPKKTAAQQDESIRVSLSRVELLNNYVGELVILQAVLNQSRAQTQSQIVQKSLTHLSKLSKEIQDISMSLRMLPLKGVFSKMQRIVRDTSRDLDKKVKLHIEGDETEVDKTVLEQLADPLVHIIRNAVDHGIENEEKDRTDAGKEAIGNVYLHAYHEGNRLVIEIGDDGGGIDPARIVASAIKKGVMREGQKISDFDAIQLIFHPGFSTKEEVSEISGRGVGMDVVKTNIANISGTVHVDSQIGKGSVFKISLPLTLAIIDGMVTKVGDERYVVPVSQIHETLQLNEENSELVTGIGLCLKLRGEVIPCFRLGQALNRKGSENAFEIAIVVRDKNQSFAIVVDDIIHQQQVVIKKIGEEIKNKKGFMGSSILGDGKPAFILDLQELVNGTLKERKHTGADAAAS